MTEELDYQLTDVNSIFGLSFLIVEYFPSDAECIEWPGA